MRVFLYARRRRRHSSGTDRGAGNKFWSAAREWDNRLARKSSFISGRERGLSKPIVLVTAATVSDLAQDLLRAGGADIAFMPDRVDEDALVAALAGQNVAAVLLRGSPPFTAKVFAAARDLKIIAKHGAGVDSVDIASASRHGVAVMVAGGANADAVAEHALAMMLSLSRELPRFDRDTRQGAWRDLNHFVRDFRVRSVGIVGYGQIGERTARLAQACGAQVVIHTRSAIALPAGMAFEPDLNRLLERVDIVSLHCPLTEATRGMMGAAQFARMKPGALLINTARGPVVDEPALVDALKSGHLAGAGLDTFAVEPPDPANPLFALPNVLVTPHIAAATTDAMVRMGTIAANNIISYLRGEVYDPRNFLNPEVFRGA
ncbi:MAG: hydroxyacid dehydrogenase [Betaproteobacteria bacterium]|nr:MAG: hydroxyacid dehydrogenase [Betaproteobacteria bacterium]